MHSKSVNGKKIAVVTYGYPLDVSMMLINSITLLAETNRVDIIVSPLDSRHARNPEWIREHFVFSPAVSRSFFYRALRRLSRELSSVAAFLSDTLAWRFQNLDLFCFSLWLKRRAAKEGYDIFIAVECYALVAAETAARNHSLIYYNMELLDWKEEDMLYPDKKPLKKLEVKALRHVDRVMITSPNRALIFGAMNTYPLERISVLPIMPLGRQPITRSAYFREKFSIPEEKKIVLYAGSFQPWAQCLDIIESMDVWPEETVLVLHTHSNDEKTLKSDYYLRMCEAAEYREVYFSTDYLPYSELGGALSSGDVGLLYYQDIDANFSEILFSSNKFGEYMAAGLPVICSPFPSLEAFVSKEGIGKSVPVEKIGEALKIILPHIDEYRHRVTQCLAEHFAFETHFAKAFEEYMADRTDDIRNAR